MVPSFWENSKNTEMGTYGVVWVPACVGCLRENLKILIFPKFGKFQCAGLPTQAAGGKNRDFFLFSKNSDNFLSESVPTSKISPELDFLAQA